MKARHLKNLTEVFRTEARYNRTAQLFLYENKVVFDCSDGEYGPIEFSIDQLEDALAAHKQKLKYEDKTTV
jgi:hypothetical protein